MKSGTTILFSANDTYCSEEYFEGMLILERKRSKQSGKQLLLILLDIDKLREGNQNEKKKVLQRLISAIDSSKPLVDVKGWYRHNSIIGIICLEARLMNGSSCNEQIDENIFHEDFFAMNVLKADLIKMFYLFYPTLWKYGNPRNKNKEN
jgi:hypothetical protein